MTTHRYHSWKDHSPGDDRANTCVVCNGGLDDCNVCGGAEASLPTDCPGRRMTANEMDDVQAGHVDYVNGEWTNLKKG